LTGTLSGFIARVKPASFGLLCAWREVLILRQHIQNTEGLHKLSLPCEGPFTVAKVTGPGSYRLQTLKGEDINNSWNVDQLCRFYA
jgi:hypothetical protein